MLDLNNSLYYIYDIILYFSFQLDHKKALILFKLKGETMLINDFEVSSFAVDFGGFLIEYGVLIQFFS